MSRDVPFTVIVMDVEFKPKLDHYNHIWSSHLDSELMVVMVVGMMIEIIKIDEFEFKIKGIVE